MSGDSGIFSDRNIAALIALLFSVTTCWMFIQQLDLPDALMVINTVVVMGWYDKVRNKQTQPEPLPLPVTNLDHP